MSSNIHRDNDGDGSAEAIEKPKDYLLLVAAMDVGGGRMLRVVIIFDPHVDGEREGNTCLPPFEPLERTSLVNTDFTRCTGSCWRCIRS